MPTQTQIRDWPTKQEAAALLGVAEKTIERMAQRRELQKSMRRRLGKPPVAVYNPDDVAREKARMESPLPAFVPKEDTTTIKGKSDKLFYQSDLTGKVSMKSILPALPELLNAVRPQYWPAFMTTVQANLYTGLPAALLQKLVEKKKLAKITEGVRSHLFERAQLDKLTAEDIKEIYE